MNQFHFKVNLKGMIDLLSNHLYSTPQVFIRELLQNAVDAITARQQVEPSHAGKISLEIFQSGDQRPTLYIEDNGIGLTEEEVHEFLSQIGHSSKRGTHEQDFIGRFGVGLLSCFIVSDEIVLITRSLKGKDVIQWRGKPDGSYTLEKLEQAMAPGTRIYLQSKPGYELYFQPQKVQEMVKHYGEFLPYPLYFYGEHPVRLNAERAPWEMTPKDALAYGRDRWQQDFLDVIPLSSALGDAKGVAYILPHPVSLQAKKTHRVYVKNMLLSEKAEKILPDWAFFVTCTLNVNQVRPTASREAFYDDPLLHVVQKDFGDCIKRYLVRLSQSNPSLLEQIIRIHYTSLKLLAIEDDELYALFIDWLPFETSLGTLKMKEIRKLSSTISYTPSLDEFRQIHQVAKAQSFCVVNGAYAYDTELIQKVPKIFPEVKVQRVDPTSFTHQFDDLSLAEREQVFEFIRLANVVLQPFQCAAEVKKFEPIDLPALYTTNEEGLFLRTAEHTQEKSNTLFASIIQQMTSQQFHSALAKLCFNFDNPLIQKAIRSRNPELNRLIIELLYVQSLLLGHYPLKKQELELMNQGLIRLIERELDR